MSRPLRIEYSGALYHVTCRGDRRGAIYRTDSDRTVWMHMLAASCSRFNFRIHAFCQMGNHFHLLVETIDGELAGGMRHLNGCYAQYFNRRHGLVGHLFQGRYKAILCQKDSYLLELARYIVLNPVRAGLVQSPIAWPWSSHRYVLGLTPKAVPAWFDRQEILSRFNENIEKAQLAYTDFVQDGIDKASPLSAVRDQLILGSDEFRASFQTGAQSRGMSEVARPQRRPRSKPLAAYFVTGASRNEAMARAYLSLAYSMSEIARHCNVCTRTVSRAVQEFESQVIKEPNASHNDAQRQG